MGYDLHGAGGYFIATCSTWRELLQLAWLCGWRPRGTRCPQFHDPEAWNASDYTSNMYQTVVEEDALCLANALENALKDIPDTMVGEMKQPIRDFIEFCKAGEFMIG